MKAPDEPSLLDNEVVKQIAEKHGATPGQVLIKWHVQRETSVIPKSVHKDRIIENLKSIEVNLDQDDMQKIAGLDRHFRYLTGDFFVTPGNSYENIYDE